MNFCKIERLKKKKDKFFGKNANVCAWITRMRKLGKILFVIVQDGSDSMQIMVKDNQLLENIKGMRRGDLLEFRGKLKKKFGSEEIEMELSSFKIINKTLEELPFDTEEQRITEETRYKYRYLDLRRTESKRKLFIKSEFIFQIRKFLNDKGFWDIETPILSQKSPEGSKCFLVQSPIDGKYYTLAQSPQIFKQTLMIGGICKYYQIAKSFRNEDSRSNRQIEFSQLDIEMSFSSSKEIKKLIEKLIKKSLKCVFGISLDLPFETISYDDAIKKYKSEKPDTRSSAEINQGKIKFL
jgi:aspartyl-tRNA synthetase